MNSESKLVDETMENRNTNKDNDQRWNIKTAYINTNETEDKREASRREWKRGGSKKNSLCVDTVFSNADLWAFK